MSVVFIPSGPTGPAGPTGPQGPVGPAGAVQNISSNTALTTGTGDITYFVNLTSAVSITLPSPSANSGRLLTFKDIKGLAQTNNLSILQNASETIENVAATKVFQTNWGSWTLVSDGANWWMI